MPRTEEANQRLRMDRRDQILHTASVLFQERGLAAVKIADLAEAAGMSQGLLYRYFSDREDLFLALVEREAASIRALYDAAAQAPGPAAERLKNLISLMLASVVENPRRHLTIIQGLTNPGRTRVLAQELKTQMVDGMKALIAEAQAEGSVSADPPETLAVLMLSTLQGLGSALIFFSADKETIIPTTEQVFRLLKP